MYFFTAFSSIFECEKCGLFLFKIFWLQITRFILKFDVIRIFALFLRDQFTIKNPLFTSYPQHRYFSSYKQNKNILLSRIFPSP
ncbi:hypothetical protein NTHI1209_02002 [Haemophilus influenzae]|uniref:Uncharacterized protein n=1 Tax=Haemophilus influenzae TaxID=727 RepID=A0A158SZR4_HAEIF|nr:hypothetical protein NTHI1209_02002 [Haemophilus influenzae]